MKQILFTLLLFCTIGFISCRKNKNDQTIKEFDQEEIQKYISANGLTGMQRDLSGGDTTGMYYKILTQGTGKVMDYPDDISLVFTMRSFDGAYYLSDTISNPTQTSISTHVYNYIGHLTANALPKAVQLGLINIMKNKGGRMRLLVPSHLGYGTSGFGSGSTSSGNRIAGNQGLDFYLNVIDNQSTYDDISVKNYIAANNLTGFTKTTSGLWYKITQAGSGAAITPTSIVTIQYTAYTFNNLITSEAVNSTDGTGAAIDISDDVRKGLVEGLQYTTPGAKLTLIMPARLAFGSSAVDNTIPAFSCLRYDINVLSVQ